jgi:hypothetical protein
MQIDVLLEEPSTVEALRIILPKILAGKAKFRLINMRNKSRLIGELPKRLLGYKKRLENGEDLRIVVLVDRDRDNCENLKARLERIAHDAGLFTRTSPDQNGRFQVVNRIAIEELEAWFIGDTEALKGAFSGLRGEAFPKSFNNPDNSGTWEHLHRFLKSKGIYKSNYPKIEAARKIAPYMDLSRNKSRSFRNFCRGIEALLSVS